MKKNIILTFCIVSLLLTIGIVLMIFWYMSTGNIAPGSFYPDIAPFYILLIGVILITIGISIAIWNEVVKITKKAKIILLVILICFIPISGFVIYNTHYIFGTTPTLPTVLFKPDINNNTLTVLFVGGGHFDNMLYWENVFLLSGYATLPTGHIDEGDVITNCSGIIKLQIRLSGQLFDLCHHSLDFT